MAGKKVLSESGEKLGEVRDYEFEPNSLAVTSVLVDPNPRQGGLFSREKEPEQNSGPHPPIIFRPCRSCS